MPSFEVGDRVRTVGYFECPDGTTGTVAMPDPFVTEVLQPGEWEGHRHTMNVPRGKVVCYYIVFDRSTDDGSADGPYSGSEIFADCLELIPKESDE